MLKRILLLILVASMVTITVALYVVPILTSHQMRVPADSTVPRARNGTLDLTETDIDSSGLIPLSGEWEYYPGRLVHPRSAPGSFPELITIPSVVENMPRGVGTVRIRVRLRRDVPVLALKARYFGSASEIWINGNLKFSAGTVHADPEIYRPRYRPAELVFSTDRQEVEILIQLANFHHRRVRLNEVYLGTASRIQHVTFLALLQDGMLLGSLIIVAVYFSILYAVRKNESANLYLALIAFVSSVRLAIVNERILVRLMPEFPPELMMKMGYVAAFLTVPFIVLYVQAVFSMPALERSARVSRYSAIALIAFVAVTPLRVYDAVFAAILPVLMVGGVYVGAVIVRERPAEIRRVWLMVTGGLILLLTGIADVLRELNILYTPELFSAGMVTFLVLQGVFLAWRFQSTYLTMEALSREVHDLNTGLEHRIRERTQDLENAIRRLNELTRTDPLTGLANRRTFDERLEMEHSIHLRNAYPVSLLMIDLDAFKPYNDNYGHPAGDECLKKVAKVLKGVANRATDLAARYGGEEFVLLLPHTDFRGACEIAERVRSSVEDLAIPHGFSPAASVVTASVGIASTSIGETPVHKLVEGADKALYQAKAEGRNRVSCGR